MDVKEMQDTEKQKKTLLNNALFSLLYIDGLIMSNIDFIGKIEEAGIEIGVVVHELLQELIKSNNFDRYTNEISSHILSAILSFTSLENIPQECYTDLMKWTYIHSISNEQRRDNCLTSNFLLLLSKEIALEYFISSFDKEFRAINELVHIMTKDNIVNTVYEALFCLWNISNDPKKIYLFEAVKEIKMLEKIVQVIKTNKVDKIARLGLATLKVLLY